MNLGPLNYKSSTLAAQPPWIMTWSAKKFWNFLGLIGLKAVWRCRLFYNTNYLKNLQPFTRKGQGFFSTLSTLSYLIDPNSAVVPYLGLHGYSELMLLFFSFFFFLICLLIITLNNYIYKTHTHKKNCQIITGGITGLKEIVKKSTTGQWNNTEVIQLT